ncbi:hypothetical protein MOQ72_26960 [Saccharopolyspora sp. K220]|uniref:hypothetical protein n=1 Tax=Saccharopolyspora soli TaxID=2926618 RepID=UPI001F57860E|nr:hypothetical protein [Saccharopolyspora soli]MCI2421089.1 hypothetical protein [Saccharopolyspora soli]
MTAYKPLPLTEVPPLEEVLAYEAELHNRADDLRWELRQAQHRVADNAKRLEVAEDQLRWCKQSQAQVRGPGLLATVTGWWYSRWLRSRSRNSRDTADHMLHTARQHLEQLHERHDQITAEQTRIAAHLDARVNPDSPEGIQRAHLTEAAHRGSDPPSWVQIYDLQDYVAAFPQRLLRHTPNGVPVLDGVDFGLRWRHEPTDNRTWPLRPVGQWRISYIPADSELYAVPAGPGPHRPVWSIGPRMPSEEAAAEVLEPLFARMDERNSLLLAIETLRCPGGNCSR